MLAHRAIHGGGRGTGGFAPPGRRERSLLAELKVARGHNRRVGEQRRPLNHIGELAHISRPRIGHEPLARIRGQCLWRQTIVGTNAREKAFGEEQGVALALTQRGQLDRQNRKSMIKILAKAVFLDRGQQVAVGRADDPGIRRLGLRATQASYCSLLDHSQELRLECLRKQSDLVEKERPLMCGLEEPGLGAPGVREGPALEAEELSFEKRFGDGRTVDVNEGPAGTGAELVDQVGDQSFTRSRLALDQDRR